MENQKRAAVMDLGTNTFHLLIAKQYAEGFTPILRRTEAVKLGEGGISRGIIQPAALERGIAAMQRFKALIDEYEVTAIKAVATSAVRNAANRQDFINEVQQKAGISIDLINGDQEAEYIYDGIKASGALSKETCLIMDIGGGSVEFIIGNESNIFWKQSFEIGAARLMDKFHRKDPIALPSIKEMTGFLNGKLTDLFRAALQYKPTLLVGSSGSFESFAEMIETDNSRAFDVQQTQVYDFDTDNLLNVIEWLAKSSHAQRKAKRAIIPVRVDMIVTASLLTIYIMQKLGLPDVRMSTWSLKEGVMAGLMA
ncbi:exopolyphosphatase [Mucilaginibacter litoreus]|uniref:Exopolyphosphatase n=1 Tax=Mucilaginibacter litoreus TaxID=1048221 RepID=A0ABW3AMK7_9SPHI